VSIVDDHVRFTTELYYFYARFIFTTSFISPTEIRTFRGLYSCFEYYAINEQSSACVAIAQW